MKKILKYTIALLAPSFLIFACQKESPATYENRPAIYFEQTDAQPELINRSFFLMNDTVTRDTVKVIIKTMGKLSDIDRPLELVQINSDDENAAKPGVHYVALTDPNIAKHFIVKANKNETVVPIVFLKDKSLNTKEVQLKLQIKPNEYFYSGIDLQTKITIETTAKATKPKLWDEYWGKQFGPTWGTEKFRYLIKVTGYTDWGTMINDATYFTYLQIKVFESYELYKAENGPLFEADGTEVVFKK